MSRTQIQSRESSHGKEVTAILVVLEMPYRSLLAALNPNAFSVHQTQERRRKVDCERERERVVCVFLLIVKEDEEDDLLFSYDLKPFWGNIFVF